MYYGTGFFVFADRIGHHRIDVQAYVTKSGRIICEFIKRKYLFSKDEKKISFGYGSGSGFCKKTAGFFTKKNLAKLRQIVAVPGIEVHFSAMTGAPSEICRFL